MDQPNKNCTKNVERLKGIYTTLKEEFYNVFLKDGLLKYKRVGN